jgi:hypothetical protein
VDVCHARGHGSDGCDGERLHFTFFVSSGNFIEEMAAGVL